MADAVLLLAGGRAERFPGKLEYAIGGEPMIVHVYRNLRAARWPIYIAGKRLFPAEIGAQLDAPLLIDRRPRSGPLWALLSACDVVRAERIFAVAADQPRLDVRALERLAQAWEPGDEAVVPEHNGRIEPLAALYARSAVLREAGPLLANGKAAMHSFIDRVAARFVPLGAEYFHNVNTREDLPGGGSWG
jgi:molybdopterin-guanine dinucleotide biosynthesis protein A